VLLALTGYEIGLLVVAAIFIVFALVVALVIPRGRPDFPARRLGIFIGICVVLFFAQMGAVLALAEVGEADEVAHGEEPTETTPTEPGEEPTETTPTEPAAGGDPVAGKEVFVTNCSSCHTLADANASGAIGPNLDETQPSQELAVDRVTNGFGGMPSFSGSLSEQQIQDVAAYVSTATG
jgi:mono/diheme cytochrome c family protein